MFTLSNYANFTSIYLSSQLVRAIYQSINQWIFKQSIKIYFNLFIYLSVNTLELYDEFTKLESSPAILGIGLDLSPHYFGYLKVGFILLW